LESEVELPEVEALLLKAQLLELVVLVVVVEELMAEA
jgi:hypothetical protein